MLAEGMEGGAEREGDDDLRHNVAAEDLDQVARVRRQDLQMGPDL